MSIKLKIFDLKNNDFVDFKKQNDLFLSIYPETNEVNLNSSICYIDPKNYVFCRFSDFTDSNGRDLYENDIVEIEEHYSGDVLIKKCYAKIVFEHGEFFAKYNDEYIDLCNKHKVYISNDLYKINPLISKNK